MKSRITLKRGLLVALLLLIGTLAGNAALVGPRRAAIFNYSSSSSPGSGCNAGQLDFSDACNTTLYVIGIR